jgi:hypothetical protein
VIFLLFGIVREKNIHKIFFQILGNFQITRTHSKSIPRQFGESHGPDPGLLSKELCITNIRWSANFARVLEIVAPLRELFVEE